MNRGTQIAYVPDHAKGEIGHPDVQFGFVTSNFSVDPHDHFCRFWRTGSVGRQLRTTSCSERCATHNLVEVPSCEQWVVDLLCSVLL